MRGFSARVVSSRYQGVLLPPPWLEAVPLPTGWSVSKKYCPSKQKLVKPAARSAKNQLVGVHGRGEAHLLEHRAVDPEVVILDVFLAHGDRGFEGFVLDLVLRSGEVLELPVSDPLPEAGPLAQPGVKFLLRGTGDEGGDLGPLGLSIPEALLEGGLEALEECRKHGLVDEHVDSLSDLDPGGGGGAAALEILEGSSGGTGAGAIGRGHGLVVDDVDGLADVSAGEAAVRTEAVAAGLDPDGLGAGGAGKCCPRSPRPGRGR